MGSEATHSKAAVLISLMLLVFGSTSTALQSFTTELEDGHWYNSGPKSADSDGDNVSDMDDSCPNGQTGWNSTNLTDYDSDGCRDSDEDDDDDNDEVLDGEDDDMPSWEEKCEPALEFLRKRASKEVAGRGRTSNHKSTASTAK